MKYEGYEAELILQNLKNIKDIKSYTLINNYGYTFTKKGKKHDLERIESLYGVDCGWSLDGTHNLTLIEALAAIAKF